jgi:predicted nucleotidyltransferase
MASEAPVQRTAGSVSRPADVARIVDTVLCWCRKRPVRLCVLFGSQVSGNVHPDSDIDLAVWTACSVPPLERLRWLRELETALSEDVSLVLVSPDLDPVVGFEIVQQGRLVFEESAGLWEAQRAQLWHAYDDSLPFRRAARERLREFAEGVRRDP